MMVAPVFREPAFVWVCALLGIGCVLVALVLRHKKFLLGLLEQFIRLPPSAKAVLVMAVVVATVFAQKPTSVSANQHESARAEAGVSATLAEGMPTAFDTCAEETQSVSEGRSQSDGERSELPARAREETEGGRHGEGFEGGDPTVASTTPTNSPCLPSSNYSVLSVADTSPLTSNDVARGYRLETVRTNESYSYARPVNARLVGTWHLTDAYEAVTRVQLPSTNLHESAPISIRDDSCQFVANSPRPFRFPIGGHVVTSLWAHTWGKVRPQLRNASNEIFVIGAPMFARHGQSFLWVAATANGSVLLTWENFFLGNPYEGGKVPSGEVPGGEGVGLSSTHRSTFPPFHFSTVSAQLELRGNGDFIARSNDVERVYRRVNPDDWDDDGIPNKEDAEPFALADVSQFGPHQTLPEGANTNHYYWIDLVVPHANARVLFEGNLPSNLPDPNFIAKAGATNRVMLLIGKDYAIRSQLPVSVVGQSDAEIEIRAENGLTHVRWPLRLEFVDADFPETSVLAARQSRASGSRGKTLQVKPSRAGGGTFRWPDNFCCYWFAPGGLPVFGCDGDCGCGGCSTGEITYEVAGCQFKYGGFHCGCSHVSPPDEPHEPREDEEDHEPQGPHVSATFSESAIIFEDAYENASGETVARRSTMSEAAFNVYGGTKGGSYSFELRDGGRLERTGGSYLPREGKLEPGESFKIKVKYKARSASGSADDIKAVATFTEEESGEELTSEATLTAVKVVITPVVTREGFPNRHKMGVRESFVVEVRPEGIVNTVRLPSDWLLSTDGSGGYTCPIRACQGGPDVVVDGVVYTPCLTVIEPTGILCASGFNRCRDGFIAMELEPYLTPLDVCFSGIRVMEVPTTDNVPTGYFANPLFEPIWNHTKARGAGDWHRPGFDNYFFRDVPSFGDACPPPLSRGVIDWRIPLAWGTDTAKEPCDAVGTIGTTYHQVFTLEASGSLRIDKFTQWIECSAEGFVTHSPGIR